MLYDYEVKTADQTIRVGFDFTDFVTQVSPDTVSYQLRADPAITVIERINSGTGLIEVDVSGGVAGRFYLYGYEARTATGKSLSDTRRVRIAAAAEIDGLPAITPFDLDLITETGDVLVTETGDTLAWS